MFPEGDAHFSIQAAFRPAGGTWQAPVDLSPVEAPGSVHPSLAVDAQGDAMVSWNRAEGPGGGPVQEAFRPVGGAWHAPVDVTQGNEWGNFSQVAFDKQGNALTMWQGDGLQSAFMPAGGTWQPPSIVGSELVAGSDFAVDGRGDAVAVWDSWTEGFLSHRVVQAAFRPAGGDWQAPVDLSEEPHGEDWRWEPYEPQVAIDEQGDAVVVWTQGEKGVLSAFKPSGGAWQTPVDLSPPGTSDGDAQVAFDGQGNALAVWDGEDGTVQSESKPAGGAWQAPVDIGHGGGPQVAFDERGDALAAWVGADGIQTAGYVATGPVLNNVSIPAEGTVGQPLTFSVSPFDVWSISGETSWSFGDGTSASGTSVTHTYTAPGIYEVTLHSADTLGNVTSTVGKVTIAPPTITPSPSTPTQAGPDTSTVTTPLATLMASQLVVVGSSARVRVACRQATCQGSIELVAQSASRRHKGRAATARNESTRARHGLVLAGGGQGRVRPAAPYVRRHAGARSPASSPSRRQAHPVGEGREDDDQVGDDRLRVGGRCLMVDGWSGNAGGC